jgi:hypothetical protein
MTRDTFDMFQEPKRGRFGDNEAEQPRQVRINGASDLIDVTLQLQHEKPLSIAVTDPATPGSKWIWLPKSQIEFEKLAGGAVKVTLPEWLAKKQGLI